MDYTETLRSIAKYLEIDEGEIFYDKKQRLMIRQLSEDPPIKGFSPIVHSFARESKHKSAVAFGHQHRYTDDIDLQASVGQWFDYISAKLIAPLFNNKEIDKIDVLTDLNNELKTRSYLAASFFTVADLAFYHIIYPIMKELSVQDKEKFLHVSRWYNHVQNLHRTRQGKDLINFSIIFLNWTCKNVEQPMATTETAAQ